VGTVQLSAAFSRQPDHLLSSSMLVYGSRFYLFLSILHTRFLNSANRQEASFGPHLDILPPAVDPTNTYKMALLSFQMTSPGCIVHTRTSGAHRPIPVDQGNSFPLTYPLLLSWLLALVSNASLLHRPCC